MLDSFSLDLDLIYVKFYVLFFNFMSKKKVLEEVSNMTFGTGIIKPVILVPHRSLSEKIETVQGKSHTVAELYRDFVLGKLDQSMIAGSPEYDPDDSEEVDSFNHFGVTLEETTQISDRGKSASKEITDERQKQQTQRKQIEEEAMKAKLRAEIEEEMRSQQQG